MHAHVVYEMKDSFIEVYHALLGDSPPPARDCAWPRSGG